MKRRTWCFAGFNFLQIVPDVFAVGRQGRVSVWPESLRMKMERGEIAREEEEMEV